MNNQKSIKKAQKGAASKTTANTIQVGEGGVKSLINSNSGNSTDSVMYNTFPIERDNTNVPIILLHNF